MLRAINPSFISLMSQLIAFVHSSKLKKVYLLRIDTQSGEAWVEGQNGTRGISLLTPTLTSVEIGHLLFLL